MWEREGRARIGIEMFYTGRQQLDEIPIEQRASRIGQRRCALELLIKVN